MNHSYTDLKVKYSSIPLLQYFNSGHIRTAKIKKNIGASFILRGLSMILGFIQVPITVHYLQETNYGIWVTIGSLLMLFNIIDIGLSNGLRNKFAEAVAVENYELARKYVSLSYLLISLIVIVVYSIFLLLYPLIDWVLLLNAPVELTSSVNLVVLIVFTSFSINFVLQIIRTILIADQKPAYSDFIKFCGSALTLISIIILSYTSEQSLVLVALSFSSVPLIIYIVLSVKFFSKTYKKYSPSIKCIDFKYTSDLTTLGIKFFIIQLSAIVLYSTDNIIIAHLYGPSYVTPYAIAFKYFSAASIIYMLIAAPYWSGFTDAYFKKDYDWIKKSIYNLRSIGIGLSYLVVIMILASSLVYDIWIGKDVGISFSLSFFMGLNVIITVLVIPYINFINGVGIIILQLVIGLTEAIVNIPLSIVLATTCNMGLTGIIVATCFSSCIAFLVYPLQYKKIIKNEAKGIWIK